MIKSRVAVPRCRRLRLLAAAIPLAALLATACSPAQTGAASSGGPARQRAAPPPSSTADCNSVTTCYTPQQLQVAYGIKPLLDRGINGRGETVVLPELAESQLNPPDVTDMRQDMAAFDNMFRLPAARIRVITTLAGARSPWLAFGEEVLDVEMVHAPCSSRLRRSPATRRPPAGIPSPAGAAPTPRYSSRCSPATRCLNLRTAPSEHGRQRGGAHLRRVIAGRRHAQRAKWDVRVRGRFGPVWSGWGSRAVAAL